MLLKEFIRGQMARHYWEVFRHRWPISGCLFRSVWTPVWIEIC